MRMAAGRAAPPPRRAAASPAATAKKYVLSLDNATALLLGVFSSGGVKGYTCGCSSCVLRGNHLLQSLGRYLRRRRTKEIAYSLCSA